MPKDDPQDEEEDDAGNARDRVKLADGGRFLPHGQLSRTMHLFTTRLSTASMNC